MINTFHSSFNPPPVPPRQGHRGPMLPKNTPLVKFLSVMLLLLMLLTFGGFVYLFHCLGMTQNEYSSSTNILKLLLQCEESRPKTSAQCKTLLEIYKSGLTQEGKVAFLTARASTVPLARLVLKWDTSTPRSEDQANTLIWDETHSVVEKIHLNSYGIVTIEYPGYYFVHSQVSFSRRHTRVPLNQIIWSRKPKKGEKVNWKQLLVSYCSLLQNSQVPDVCTASHAGVFELEKDQQLFVNVTGRDLVNPESTFGLFKLQD